MKERRKIVFIIVALLILILGGTIGYLYLLDLSWIDAIYMTVITISTVGYREVVDMTDTAKVFSIFMIIGGLGIAGYGATSVFALFFEGTFRSAWRRRRMEKKISQFQDHYILCGAGETGQQVIQQFIRSQVDFVVIEKDEAKVLELQGEGVFIIQGDATNEETLNRCGIHRAKGLISSLSNDADNVYTVLTARQMNPDIYIVSRAIEKNAGEKLKRAGANNTISPNEIGGRRMAAVALRPSIISFLDVITQNGDVELDLEDVVVGEGSKFLGKALKEVRIPDTIGLIILAIRRQGQKDFIFNPSSDEILRLGDVMVVLGRSEQVDKLKILACSQ
jgi:voltage-gated potassium channel